MNRSSDESAPRRVLQSGTFDVQNYGDLLFPLLASFRLRRWNIEVLPVSPAGLNVGWEGALQSRSFKEMLNAREEIHGILIGGGNIIHAGPANLRDYEMDDLFDWAYSGLWFGATLVAAMRNVPVAWNAPGVPRPMTSQLNEAVLVSALRAADYLSVRDAASADSLGAERGDCRIVPDTAVDVARMWPRSMLATPFRSLLERKNAPRDAKYLAINVKERSLDIDHATMATLIEQLAHAHGLTPLLLAIGPCHNDHATARHIARHLRFAHVLVDEPTGLMEIAAAIAGATLYMGASLHGYVTCAAYDVRGVMVARPALAKFGGFLTQIDRLEDLAIGWREAFTAAARRLAQPPRRAIPEKVYRTVDLHWERIAEAFIKPAQKMAERTRFLRRYVEHGAKSLGPEWLFTPLLGRRTRTGFRT